MTALGWIIAFQVGAFLLFIAVGAGVGGARERRHLRELDEREAALSHIVVTDLRTAPPGMTPAAGRMVVGEVVIASDYWKTLSASLRGLVGGEVRAYRPVMDRARREARLRMVEQAAADGARAVINVRFETSTVAVLGVEVVCSGTALR